MSLEFLKWRKKTGKDTGKYNSVRMNEIKKLLEIGEEEYD